MHPRIVKPRIRPKNLPKINPIPSTPKSDISIDIKFAQTVTSSYELKGRTQIEDLPDLGTASRDRFCELLQKKFHECKILCNFYNTIGDFENKARKEKYLTEIYEFLKQPAYFNLVTKEAWNECFEMIYVNIIRAAPPVPELSRAPVFYDDVCDTIYEAAWPHISIVYSIFMVILDSPSFREAIFSPSITERFLTKLINLFNTSDYRERGILKMVLYRIYVKFYDRRVFIRSTVRGIFNSFTHETHYFNGISELLEFFSPIITGYSVPLKDEHYNFYYKAILPLHLSQFLNSFVKNLISCITEYLKKDEQLLIPTIRYLISTYPVSCPYKQVYYINEITNLTYLLSESDFLTNCDEIMSFLGKCLVSTNTKVSEAVILFLIDQRFSGILADYSTKVFPIISGYLYYSGASHWSPEIRNRAVTVIKYLMNTNGSIFQQCAQHLKAQELQIIQNEEDTVSRWKLIAEFANETNAVDGLSSQLFLQDVPFFREETKK